MPEHNVDEILEIIWMKREKGKNSLDEIREEIKKENLPDDLENMVKENIISIDNGRVEFRESGDKLATNLIRRHRLAERLLVDILETKEECLEESACEFEHILSEEVTDAICTLLGHPKMCPHGLPVPEGKCCREAYEKTGSVIVSLDKLEIGKWATIAYILAQQHPRIHKLTSFGISPGAKIKVHQKYPTYVIQVEETQIALEKDIIKDIYVRV